MNQCRIIGLRTGVIVGILTVVLMLGFYFVDKRQFVISTFYTYIFYWVGMIWATGKAKATIAPEERSYHNLLQTPFIVFLVANVFYYAMMFIMFNWVDNSLMEVTKGFFNELVDWVSKMPGNEDQKENFTKIKQDLNTSLNSYNLKSLSLEFANSLFKGFILSVIITFFFTIRKSKI